MQAIGDVGTFIGGCLFTTEITTGARANSAPRHVCLPSVNGPLTRKDTRHGGGAGSGTAAQSTQQVRGGQGRSGRQQPDATTLMVRNLPRRVTLKSFVAELDQCGFAGLYDWLFLPAFKTTGNTKGFGFINFHTPVMARCFFEEWKGSQRFGLQGRYKISVTEAEIQGFHANVAGYQGTDDQKNMLILRTTSADAAATSSSSAAPANAASPPANDEQSSSSSAAPAAMQEEDEMTPTAPPEWAVPMPSFGRSAPRLRRGRRH